MNRYKDLSEGKDIDMNGMQIFYYQNNEIRTIQRDGEPWFVLRDVCKVLGIGNAADVYNRLDTDEKGVGLIDTPGGKQQMNIIDESGLYNVILRSDKPEAKRFKRWITHEVLPAIRKHGAYMTAETLEAALLNPDTMIKLCTALKEEQDKRKALEIANSALTVDNQIMKPKVDYFDELVDRNLLTNFRETAKQLNINPKAFVTFLLDHKYVYRDKRGKLLPYQQHKDAGLFEVKECVNNKTQWSGTQTMITPKGRETLRLLCVAAL